MNDPVAATAHPARRVVLTGGPGAGKTHITGLLAERYPQRFFAVPESATHVYTAAGTRWDRLTIDQRRQTQRQIYRNQIEQEARLLADHPGHTLLLDRGTIDGAAYWPDGPADYWADLGTTLDAQLARYDRVILLETAAALGIYDGSVSNAIRFEDAAGAVASGLRLRDLWERHPRLDHVPAAKTIEAKIAAVVALLDGLE